MALQWHARHLTPWRHWGRVYPHLGAVGQLPKPAPAMVYSLRRIAADPQIGRMYSISSPIVIINSTWNVIVGI